MEVWYVHTSKIIDTIFPFRCEEINLFQVILISKTGQVLRFICNEIGIGSRKPDVLRLVVLASTQNINGLLAYRTTGAAKQNTLGIYLSIPMYV